MKNKGKTRISTLIFAVMLCMAAFPLTAYAGGGPATEEPEVTPVVETAPEPRPLTPDGTGTTVDHVTEADGKEFYTITSADGNIFYLIIDHQRETENVYFLNVVTEQDLMALAEQSGNGGTSGASAIPDTTPAPEPTPEPEPVPDPVPEPEKGGNMGMMIFVALVVIAGGGAAYYFKIYRPKQEQAETGEDFDDYEADESDIYAEETEDDSSPWDVEAEDE